jgi:hypothetical protein
VRRKSFREDRKPADGTEAATEKWDFGTSRWLFSKIYTIARYMRRGRSQQRRIASFGTDPLFAAMQQDARN